VKPAPRRVAWAAGLVAAGSLLAAAPAASGPVEAPLCEGRPATIVGTAGADQLLGSAGHDVIYGGPGADVIRGLAAADKLCGGSGDDSISGGLLVDRISGGLGADHISGDTGSDRLRGGEGSDTIRGGRGNDIAEGGDGSDLVFGDLGDDTVRGGPGDRDEAAGGLGIDSVSGGAGNGDVVSGDYGYDRMSGGPGSGDVASFASAVSDRGRGVRASLRTGHASGDGLDHMRLFENLEGSAFADVLHGNARDNEIDGGPGDDTIYGGRGTDLAIGEQGSDGCKGATNVSCGPERPITASAYMQVDSSPAGGGGLVVIGGPGSDRITASFDPASRLFEVEAARPLAIGPNCTRLGETLLQVVCSPGERGWRLIVDLGKGNDRLLLRGAFTGIDTVRATGGPGDDVLHGGMSGDLLEAGTGADRLYGRSGSDGLIGGVPGADLLVGGRGGDLVGAGGACIGGALVGGPGRDNASFAETSAHPGVLYASLAAGYAIIRANPHCRPVRIAHSNEDLEGSFDYDILVGDRGANSIFGQPGVDSFYGRGGDDTIDARDGERDGFISCGRGPDIVRRDPSDPGGRAC
jgi:Ca2+-binding RTX toxin-like protein